MWKVVGTVSSNDNKKNRSKDQVNCEPFAQASRLRLNESQLSGQQSHQFMTEYFAKRKSPEGSLHRVLSQKTIQVRQATSPPASLRQLQSPRNINKTEQILGGGSVELDSSPEIEKRQTFKPVQVESQKGNISGKCQKIEEQLKIVKEEQSKIRKVIRQEVESFKGQLMRFEKEVAQKIEKIEVQNQKSTRQNVNPQLLARIKQEGVRFNEKMRELDLRKEQVKARYKDKVRNE